MGRTEDGKVLLFPKKDNRLRIGLDLDVDGLWEGEHFYFPVRYDLSGQLKQRTPIARGVITHYNARFAHEILFDYLLAYTDWERPYMNLKKRSGPSDVDLGTMIEVYKIAKEGMTHIFVNEWGKADIQYPAGPLTSEQMARIKELENELIQPPKVGTLALSHSPCQIIVLDGEDERGDRTREIYTPKQGSFPIGARVVIGWPKNPMPFENARVYQL